MNVIQAVILGIVQSITEWLPVSSSAHLAIAGRILQAEADIFFFVLLHLATLISLILYFRRKIFDYLIDKKKILFLSQKGLFVAYATVPIFIAGFIFHDLIEKQFTSFPTIGVFLIINSAILFSTRFFNGKKSLGFGKAIFVGLMQMFALFPGISRSGTTISSSLLSGMKKEEAMMFSLMLSIPAILGAFAYQVLTVPMNFEINMIAGFIAAVIGGYIGLSILVKRIKEGAFHKYWMYSLILGIIMLFN